MKNNFDKLIELAKLELSKVTTRNDLLNLKSQYLGSGSELAEAVSKLKTVKSSERADLGRSINMAKNQLDEAFKMRLIELESNLSFSSIDVSAPGRINKYSRASLHPTTQMLAETYQVFTELGFAIVDSNEIETDWYNFEALNIPAEHPARDMQDTFYVDNGKMDMLPRTHTSGMQVRFMEQNKPPFKIIVPGKVFRNEDEDATHSWEFYQVEGLVVGEGVSMSDLKGTLRRVMQRLLGEDAKIRFRANYFPYTEPSVEFDGWHNGKWLELGGAGMVHPQVLRNGGIDPEKYRGFAFGWGPERFAAIKFGLTDIRQLWRPNLRYLSQF
jgi:phenylalanyl-tRNA synthetase alpha chain